MKPGDLVRLVSEDHSTQVYVAAIDVREQWVFDEGTLALFLDELPSQHMNGEKKLRILVEGRMGWVYVSECEVIDEAG